MLIENKSINQKPEDIYPINRAIYMKDKINGKIDVGVIFIQCPFCEDIYKRENKIVITDLEPNYCSKCKEFSAIYKIVWEEEVKRENIHHTIKLLSWQPKTYRKGDTKRILKEKGKLVGLFKLKEKREYDDFQIKYKTEKEIRENERKKLIGRFKGLVNLLGIETEKKMLLEELKKLESGVKSGN